jgi:hypothetical protein
MRYLLFISCLFLSACVSPYKKLRPVPGDPSCIIHLKPEFNGVLYKTEVAVVGKHISGLLLIKTMPDSSVRLVFTSETGFKFFDFEFFADSGFKVNYILKQMDKEALIKTLRNDFELILWRNTGIQNPQVLSDGLNHYHVFPREKGVNYYITDTTCTKLVRIEKASKRKPVVEIILQEYHNNIPDSIWIAHKNKTFNFTIALKRLEK